MLKIRRREIEAGREQHRKDELKELRERMATAWEKQERRRAELQLRKELDAGTRARAVKNAMEDVIDKRLGGKPC